MNEFIFNIKQIFTDVLKDRSVNEYYIPPYQRGYKWASDSRYDQVPQMLIDIYYAFKQNTDEYYLQYITVQKNFKEKRFEVIDGQQRLTTLSILLYRYSFLSGEENVAEDKVKYARYENLNIFNCMGHPMYGTICIYKSIKSQDKYYILKSARCIDLFLNGLKQKEELVEYMTFLLEKVKIILNEESEFVSPEETFANLNDNKVPLTNAYLIKGLLLTLAVTEVLPSGIHANYKEIMDQRSIMGRTWDEIMSWIEDKKVSHYFFGKKEGGMENLLHLVEFNSSEQSTEDEVIKEFAAKLDPNGQKWETDLQLFNKFNEKIKDRRSAEDVLHQIKHIYRVFKSLYDNYEDCTLFNKIGYLFFRKNYDKENDRVKKHEDLLKTIIKKGNSELNSYVNDRLVKVIPELNESSIKKFYYKQHNPRLTNLLLSFSVFPEESNKSYRFDFFKYDEEKWSFEHIFPQHPSGKITIPPVAKPFVNRAIQNKLNPLNEKKEKGEVLNESENEIYSELQNAMKIINNNEKLEITKSLSFLYEANIDIHEVGNMALLSGGANAAISNNPFVAKRSILQNKIQDGSFVPRHTVDVFNKILPAISRINEENNEKEYYSLNPELHIWDENDVKAHTVWMITRNKQIREGF